MTWPTCLPASSSLQPLLLLLLLLWQMFAFSFGHNCFKLFWRTVSLSVSPLKPFYVSRFCLSSVFCLQSSLFSPQSSVVSQPRPEMIFKYLLANSAFFPSYAAHTASVFGCHLCALLWLQDIIIIFWYVMQRTFCCSCCCCHCCCSSVHVGVARYLNVFKLDMLRPMWAQIGQEVDMLSDC